MIGHKIFNTRWAIHAAFKLSEQNIIKFEILKFDCYNGSWTNVLYLAEPFWSTTSRAHHTKIGWLDKRTKRWSKGKSGRVPRLFQRASGYFKVFFPATNFLFPIFCKTKILLNNLLKVEINKFGINNIEYQTIYYNDIWYVRMYKKRCDYWTEKDLIPHLTKIL